MEKLQEVNLLYIISARSLKTQTVTQSPNSPVIVSVNQSLTFTCTTTYSVRFILFKDSTLPSAITAVTLGIINGACEELGIESTTKYGTQCESVNGPFIFTIYSVTRQHHNSRITCTIQYGNNTKRDIASAVTTILVNGMLKI